jgi:hypothetical protein
MGTRFNAVPFPSAPSGVVTNEFPNRNVALNPDFANHGVFPSATQVGGDFDHRPHVTSSCYNYGNPHSDGEFLRYQYVFQRGPSPRANSSPSCRFNDYTLVWSASDRPQADGWWSQDKVAVHSGQVLTLPALNCILAHERAHVSGQGPNSSIGAAGFTECMHALGISRYGVVIVDNVDHQSRGTPKVGRWQSSTLSVVTDGEADMTYLFDPKKIPHWMAVPGAPFYLCARRVPVDELKSKGRYKYRLGEGSGYIVPSKPGITQNPFQVWMVAGEEPMVADQMGKDDAGYDAFGEVVHLGHVMDTSKRPDIPETTRCVTDNAISTECGVCTVSLSYRPHGAW